MGHPRVKLNNFWGAAHRFEPCLMSLMKSHEHVGYCYLKHRAVWNPWQRTKLYTHLHLEATPIRQLHLQEQRAVVHRLAHQLGFINTSKADPEGCSARMVCVLRPHTTSAQPPSAESASAEVAASSREAGDFRTFSIEEALSHRLTVCLVSFRKAGVI